MFPLPPVFVIVAVEGGYSSPLSSYGDENCRIDNTDDDNRNYDKNAQENI